MDSNFNSNIDNCSHSCQDQKTNNLYNHSIKDNTDLNNNSVNKQD